MTRFEAMHGLAIKKFGTPAAVADLLGAPPEEVQAGLEAALAEGLAMGAKGAFMLTPKGQQALAAEYPAQFAAHRADPALSAGYERFEAVNTDLKQLITEWQTMTVAGETVPNDHSDADYDNRIIDRLGELHERAEPLLRGLAARLPRLGRYCERLSAALDKAEAGEIAFVSGAKIDSYHTVWFELHEDLLRVLDRSRDD
ncbi:MAG: hypothetical protein ACK5YW_04460 [Betaproteobacteria bacterium]|jgi:hypothetical protein|nr:hypothetical protein [Rhodocyclaceae bacterium]MCA3134574.1 hypothetical protein [Rhodocyclaceae bacterium]MCA3143625.1 hypothetical protein [Rhodocyclaceae bacterium]MCA3145511.1 hypothetical protein [Rhodocyclaceae bacterium]